MTVFDMLVAAGPAKMAEILVDSKIAFGDAALRGAGIDGYKTSKEIRDFMIKQHYNYLISECKENANG